MEKAAIHKEHNNFSDHMTVLLALIQLKMLMLSYGSLSMGYVQAIFKITFLPPNVTTVKGRLLVLINNANSRTFLLKQICQWTPAPVQI